MDIVLNTGNILLVGSILLFMSILAAKTGYRFGVPMLLLFLVVGMLFGSDGIGIQFNNPAATQFIGMMALSIILFSGGMDTKYAEIRPVVGQGVVLATFGVVLTAFLTGGFIYLISQYFRGIPNLTFAQSLLLASIMSSTDSASVFSILRSKGLRLKENLRPMLELESGSNDPMAYMLTILLIQVIRSGDMGIGQSVLMVLIQLSVGAVAGYLLGRLAIRVVNRINVDNEALYPILLLAYVFFVFSITDLIRGNGYLAVYIAGLVVGNHKIVHKKSITVFFDGFAWLSQLIMFLTLGLLVSPRQVLSVAGTGLLVGSFLIICSRPLSVFTCLAPFRKITLKAKTFVSWVGLRGAVPIIFATYPLIADIEHSQLMFNIVFFITILSLLIQGTSVNYFATLLGLGTPVEKKKIFSDFKLPKEVKSTLSEMEVTPEMLADGNTLLNLNIPEHTLVVMVHRDDHFFVPSSKTNLFAGDLLLMISDSEPLEGAYALSNSDTTR